MRKWVVLDKPVGQTPLQCMEAWRSTQPANYQEVPLTYAGRLDPLAAGTLLVLLGEECKQKEQYLALDKAYQVEILLGVGTDTGDVLGRLKPSLSHLPSITPDRLRRTVTSFVGEITLPYPAFSSKPIAGIPLHTWAAMGRLNEISIPHKTSQIYSATIQSEKTVSAEALYTAVQTKIATIPPVTETRKALGNDFRRVAVLEDWHQWHTTQPPKAMYPIATIHCICSSGTYMRSLAEYIGQVLEVPALAFSITRTHIGRYHTLVGRSGFWWPLYR